MAYATGNWWLFDVEICAMLAMLKDILEVRGAVSKDQADIKTACRGSNLAATGSTP